MFGSCIIIVFTLKEGFVYISLYREISTYSSTLYCISFYVSAQLPMILSVTQSHVAIMGGVGMILNISK